jgi:hypothetical protein
MKTLRLFFIVLLTALMITDVSAQINRRIKGSGDVTTESRNISGFTGVKTATAIDIYLTQGNGFNVEVEADDNLMEYIVTEVKNGVLEVYLDRVNLTYHKKMAVHVTMEDVDYLSASSAGDIIGVTPIKADELKVRTSSAGDVKIEVTANMLDLSTSSSGDITISGEADYLEAKTSSAGDIKGAELVVREADLSSSSAGDIKVTVTERLKARASSAGDIHYYGNPAYVDAHSSSAGDVIKK